VWVYLRVKGIDINRYPEYHGDFGKGSVQRKILSGRAL
jgi:hypothetical protein